MTIAVMDLRWLTALCQVALGLALLFVVLKVWFMALHDRAQLFGPMFTDHGLRWLLNGLPHVAFLGVFWIVSGVSKWAFYARWWGTFDTELALAIGAFEAVIAVWTVLTFVGVAWRFGRDGKH